MSRPTSIRRDRRARLSGLASAAAVWAFCLACTGSLDGQAAKPTRPLAAPRLAPARPAAPARTTTRPNPAAPIPSAPAANSDTTPQTNRDVSGAANSSAPSGSAPRRNPGPEGIPAPGLTSSQAQSGSFQTAQKPQVPGANTGHVGQSPQQHLADWMDAHRNLPLPQQQKALAEEPGFRSLNPQEQQRIHERLTELNRMPPEQRQKAIQRTEAMERLAPAQRQQVRSAVAQVGSLPEDRRHAVSRAFYTLRDLPADQRERVMNSPRFRGQFNDQERGAINGLLDVAPMFPPLQAPPPH